MQYLLQREYLQSYFTSYDTGYVTYVKVTDNLEVQYEQRVCFFKKPITDAPTGGVSCVKLKGGLPEVGPNCVQINAQWCR